MLAMVLESPGSALQQAELPIPEYGTNEILFKVLACGVCRTDLHIMDGELSAPKIAPQDRRSLARWLPRVSTLSGMPLVRGWVCLG
jgi:NADPH:quinone reductase-like Zn-dependent oxidoreductase